MIKPYYDHAGITIYHGDCRDILPHLDPVDLVLTDPPYGIGEARGKNKSRGFLAVSKDYGFSKWDDKPPDKDTVFLTLGAAKHSILFGGNYFEGLSPSACWIVWDKENGNTDFADCELAWTTFPGATRLFKYRWQGMLQGNMKDKEFRSHPTQKPRPLMIWCIQFADRYQDNTTILDPFMGSGTTLRAAKDLGRKAIGIEIEEKYCEIAVKRLSQEVLPL